MPFAGETACLLTALLWTVAMGLYRAPVVEHGARTVNLFKCVLGATLQGLTVLFVGELSSLRAASLDTLLVLAASGWIGLTLGDTALFGAVARLGVHRTVLLQTMAPLFAALIAWAWQGELPASAQVLGAVVILGGVAIVVAPSRGGATSAARPRGGSVASGVALGVLAALGQGVGVVMAKAGMADLAVLPASFVRLAAAALGLAALAASRERWLKIEGLATHRALWTRVLPAAFFGTYLGLFLMMLGIALAPAAIAATLLAVGPIYALALEAFVERRPPTAQGLCGTLLAIAGVALLTWR